MFTILLIDNQPVMRLGLTSCLKIDFKQSTIIGANNLAAFYKSNPGGIPDLLILGLNQNSEENNFKWIKKFKRHYPETALILYDGEVRNIKLMPYLESMIDGYILKKSSPEVLIKCAKKILREKRYIHNESFDVLLKKLPNERKFILVNQISLTCREFEIATYLSRGMKTSIIAKTTGRKPSTISTFKMHIFKKLQVDNIIKLRDVICQQNIESYQ
jgi:DNA-binding NarL/FixJ family response regulator